MAEIRWSDFAIENLNDIGNYIEKDSLKFAEITITRLFDATDILIQFPLSGRIVPEFKEKEIRELICGNYRIVYRVINLDRIDILTVHHSARLLNDISK